MLSCVAKFWEVMLFYYWNLISSGMGCQCGLKQFIYRNTRLLCIYMKIRLNIEYNNGTNMVDRVYRKYNKCYGHIYYKCQECSKIAAKDRAQL